MARFMLSRKLYHLLVITSQKMTCQLKTPFCQLFATDKNTCKKTCQFSYSNVRPKQYLAYNIIWFDTRTVKVSKTSFILVTIVSIVN